MLIRPLNITGTRIELRYSRAHESTRILRRPISTDKVFIFAVPNVPPLNGYRSVCKSPNDSVKPESSVNDEGKFVAEPHISRGFWSRRWPIRHADRRDRRNPNGIFPAFHELCAATTETVRRNFCGNFCGLFAVFFLSLLGLFRERSVARDSCSVFMLLFFLAEDRWMFRCFD